MEHLLLPYRPTDHISQGNVLVLAPHPDDEIFGCGGAIAKHVRAGDKVKVIIITDGRAQQRENVNDDTYSRQRQEESRLAAAVLGYTDLEFWDLPDRGVAYGERLLLRIEEAVKENQATLVYAPSVLEAHPDHRTTAMLAVEAVRRQPNDIHLAMYEIGIPLKPNVLLDITGVMDLKKQAMACFKTQLLVQEYDSQIAALNTYRAYSLPQAVTAAEAYHVVSSTELKNDFLDLYQSEYVRQTKLGLQIEIQNDPLVTVIVRSMDRSMLSQTLDSIALQTYPNIEVILVNATGREHKHVGEWCGRFPLKTAGSNKPLNRGEAANLGLNKSSGQFISFLDDDDLWEPDHISQLVNSILSNPGYGVVYSGTKVLDERSGQDNKGAELVFSREYHPTLLLVTNYIPNNSVLVSRDIINLGCRFDENMNVYEDWDFLITLSCHTNFLHTGCITSIYRITNSSGIGVHPDNLIEQRKILTRFFEKWKLLWSDDQFLDILAIASKANHGLHPNSIYNLDLESAVLKLGMQDTILEEKYARLQETHALLQEKDARLQETHALLQEKSNIIRKISDSLPYKLYRVLRHIIGRDQR